MNCNSNACFMQTQLPWAPPPQYGLYLLLSFFRRFACESSRPLGSFPELLSKSQTHSLIMPSSPAVSKVLDPGPPFSSDPGSHHTSLTTSSPCAPGR